VDESHSDDRADGPVDDELATDPGSSWSGLGATRGPRTPAEGVRIIGAEEAAAAVEAGHVSGRVPEDAPRFGDVPPSPSGPRPPLRFPGADPASVAKPPVVVPPPEPEHRPSYSMWDDPSPVETTDPPRVGTFEELIARAEEEAKASARVGWPSAPPPASSSSYGGGGGGGGISASAPDDPWPAPAGTEGGDPWPPSRGADPLDESTWPAPSRAADPQAVDRAWPPPSVPGPTPAGSSVWGSDAPGTDFDDDGGKWDFFDEPGSSRRFEDGYPPAPPEPAAQAIDVSEEPSGSIPLPHWTEPPSGEVPRILPDQPPPDSTEEITGWSSTGPRWRDQSNDWDDADFGEAILDDQSARIGALDQSRGDDEDLFAFDASPPPPPPSAAVQAPPPPPLLAEPGPGPAPRSRARAAAPQAPSRGGGGGGDGPFGGLLAGRDDVTTRVITGVVAAGVLLAAAVVGPGALLVVAVAALTMAAAELLQALRARGYQPATLLGLVGTAGIGIGAFAKGETALPVVTTLMVVFTFLWYLAGVVKARPTMNVAVSIMAFLYVGFLGSFAGLLLSFPLGHGVGLVLGAVLATVAHDIGSYFAGRWGGKTPLAPNISPGKTFEGLVGGTFATLIVSVLLVSQIEPWHSAGRTFWLAVVVSIAAPLGDLCESMIKRDLGIKDMGKLLPGHGGVLDRIDALLFVIPATYYLIRLLNFA
jgi:phosphatidate cytidylyltransferase